MRYGCWRLPCRRALHRESRCRLRQPEIPKGQGAGQPAIPAESLQNHTVPPQTFVDVLCGTIRKNGMASRSDVQSFDFRTLVLVEEQYPEISTYYLTESPAILTTEFVPAALRASQ